MPCRTSERRDGGEKNDTKTENVPVSIRFAYCSQRQMWAELDTEKTADRSKNAGSLISLFTVMFPLKRNVFSYIIFLSVIAVNTA